MLCSRLMLLSATSHCPPVSPTGSLQAKRMSQRSLSQRRTRIQRKRVMRMTKKRKISMCEMCATNWRPLVPLSHYHSCYMDNCLVLTDVLLTIFLGSWMWHTTRTQFALKEKNLKVRNVTWIFSPELQLNFNAFPQIFF